MRVRRGIDFVPFPHELEEKQHEKQRLPGLAGNLRGGRTKPCYFSAVTEEKGETYLDLFRPRCTLWIYFDLTNKIHLLDGGCTMTTDGRCSLRSIFARYPILLC